MNYRDTTMASNKSLSIVDSESFVVEPEMLAQAHLKTGITKPHPHDVLYGKGNGINMHPGNQYYRSLVKHLKNEYVMSEKSDKPTFAKYIFKHIRLLDPPGRFLRKEENGERWDVVSLKFAMEKIRQALREDAGKVKKEIENGKRKVTTSVCISIDSYRCVDAPRSLQSANSSTTTKKSTTTGVLTENGSTYHSTTMGNNFRRVSTNNQNVNNFNPCLNNPPQYALVPVNHQLSSFSNQSSMRTSSLLSHPAWTENQIRADYLSINPNLLNHSTNSSYLNQHSSGNGSITSGPAMNQSVNSNPQSLYNQQMNGRISNQSYGVSTTNGCYYNSSLGHSFLQNCNVEQFPPSMATNTRVSITTTKPHQVPVSIANHNVLSSSPSMMGTALRTNMNGSMPSTIGFFTKEPTFCSPQSVETEEESESNMHHSSSSHTTRKMYPHNHNSIRNKHFDEQKDEKTVTNKTTKDNDLEEFLPGEMTDNNNNDYDDLEEFPGGTTSHNHSNFEEDDDFKEGFLEENSKIGGENKFVPVSFRASENGQQSAHPSDGFTNTGTKYKSCEPYEPRRHSLYHPDFDRRSKIERRKSAMIIANFLQKLEDMSDDSDEDDYELERKSNTKRKLNDIGKLRESLRSSLRIDEVFTHDRKKADRRKSQRASLVLRQSLLKSLANPVPKQKSSSKNVEKMYLPHLSHTKIDRRRSTITERSSELLKVFGPEHKAMPRKSVKQILPDVLDPVSTDTLIESVLKSGDSLVIDDNMLKMLHELGDETEEWEPTPSNDCEVNVNISSGVTKLNL